MLSNASIETGADKWAQSTLSPFFFQERCEFVRKPVSICCLYLGKIKESQKGYTPLTVSMRNPTEISPWKLWINYKNIVWNSRPPAREACCLQGKAGGGRALWDDLPFLPGCAWTLSRQLYRDQGSLCRGQAPGTGCWARLSPGGPRDCHLGVSAWRPLWALLDTTPPSGSPAGCERLWAGPLSYQTRTPQATVSLWVSGTPGSGPGP